MMFQRLINNLKQWRLKQKQEAELKKHNLLTYIDQQLSWANSIIEQHHSDFAEIKRLLDGYQIKDVDGDVLQTEWSDADHIIKDDIKNSAIYQQLIKQADAYGIKIKLKQEESEEHDDEERIIFYLDLSKK